MLEPLQIPTYRASTLSFKHEQWGHHYGLLTGSIQTRLPCIPDGSWFIASTCLLSKSFLALGSISLRSTDINNGDAIMAHIPIWTFCWVALKP